MQKANALLAQIVGGVDATAAATETLAAYGPPVLEFGYEAEQKRAELASGMKQIKQMSQL